MNTIAQPIQHLSKWNLKGESKTNSTSKRRQKENNKNDTK